MDSGYLRRPWVYTWGTDIANSNSKQNKTNIKQKSTCGTTANLETFAQQKKPSPKEWEKIFVKTIYQVRG